MPRDVSELASLSRDSYEQRCAGTLPVPSIRASASIKPFFDGALVTMNSEDYRHLAEEEAALAKAAVSNASRAQHYAMAAYYNRLADARERLVTVGEALTTDASSGA